jgi:hypothetical protein
MRRSHQQGWSWLVTSLAYGNAKLVATKNFEFCDLKWKKLSVTRDDFKLTIVVRPAQLLFLQVIHN